MVASGLGLRLGASRIPLQVLKVTARTQCLFVGYQVIQGDEVNRDAEEAAIDPLFPRFGKTDARDLGEDINAHRRNSDLIDHLLVGQRFGGYFVVINGSTELLERFDHTQGVLP